jgi:putative SOS response-associated peptidase YedK
MLATFVAAPGADVASVHNRQPAILEPAQLGNWLASASDESGLAVLQPSGAGTLAARAVSSRANSVSNDDPECLIEAPVETSARRPPQQLSLLGDDS